MAKTAAEAAFDEGLCNWHTLEKLVVPSEDDNSMQDAVVKSLKDLLTPLGRVHLVGSAAAGLVLPNSDIDLLVLIPNYQDARHSHYLSEVAKLLESSVELRDVQLGSLSVQCRHQFLNIDILVSGSNVAASSSSSSMLQDLG